MGIDGHVHNELSRGHSGIANTATNVPWISHVSDAASSGIPQAIVLGVSGLFLASPLLRCQWPTSQLRPFSKASGIRYKYEILSQVARASALSFMAVAFFHNRAHLLDAILLGYAFLLGLTRLFADVLWRRAALHQVNFVLVSQLVLLCIAQFLPCIGLNHSCTRDTGVIGSAAALAVALLIAMLTPREWVQPQLAEEIPGFGIPDEPAPEEVCGWLDYYCTYQWLNPVIWKGTLRKLDMSDIPRLAWYDDPLYLLRQVQDARAACKSTFWTTLRFQRTELLLMSLWIGSAFIVENVAPFGMFNLLAYLDNPDAADYKPWVWLLLTFFGPLLRSVLFQGYVFTSTRLIVRVKSAVTQELYHKALASMEIEDDPFSESLDAASRENETDVNRTKSTSAGRLANLMAADVDAIFRSRDMIMVIVGLPAGSIVSFIGLYRMLGWTSVVGISILILVVPISIYLGKMMYNMQKKVRQAQDSRISLVTEYLASIKAIKYFGWEKPATAKIIQSRAIEQKGLWNLSVLQIVINQVTQVLPLLSLLIMFFLHVIVDKRRLTASTAFTTVYLADHIRRNIMMASMFSRKFAATLVAFKRLDRYFASAVPLIKYPEGPLRLVKASFRRNKKANFWLDEISIDFVEGGLNVITGQSGSGKTTLLLSILGETYLEGGSVTAPSDVAYASQTSWLQNQTIRENILFGSPMERLRYDTIVAACCLPQDFRDLPNRDQTTVGENGTSLSGGQKARVALARALYSKAPLLLLDDIFSALDPRTSAGVWKDCFCSDLLKGRTTVLVTQVPWISAQADLAILLERGRVKEAEANIGISRKPIKIADVFAGDADDSSLTEIETPPDPELQADGDALNDPSKVAQDVPVQDIVDQEAKASGAFSRWSVFQYMRYFGHPLFAASCCLGLALSNAFTFGTTYWLSIWVEADDGESDVNVAYYLTIFAVIIFLDLVVFGAVIAIFEWGGWRAARRLHNEFIRAVMRVPLSWYKTIPVGRITNRFSGDMTSIDGTLSGMMRSTVDIFLSFFFRLGAVSSIMPIFMIPALITCLFGVMFGEMYTRTAVVVQRLTSSAQSPVFSQFADTLAGLSIIRARSGKAKEFGFGLADKFRTWSAVAETNYNCNRWVSIRIDFVTSLVSLFAGAIAISRAGLVGAGLVGFSLTNANDLSSTVLYLVRSMNDLEVEMQSVSNAHCELAVNRWDIKMMLIHVTNSFIVSKSTSS